MKRKMKMMYVSRRKALARALSRARRARRRALIKMKRDMMRARRRAKWSEVMYNG